MIVLENKCSTCKDTYEIKLNIPAQCHPCFYNEHIKQFESKKKWFYIKRFSYFFIFNLLPAYIIAITMGVKWEVIYCLGVSAGICMPSLVDWCMRKF